MYIGNFADTTVYEKVCKVLKKTSLIKGIKKALPIAQTSCLEGFHSLLNQFAPKMIAYSYQGMYCR
jgi:solute carrier family 8 (sodium/calcium exchanger)